MTTALLRSGRAIGIATLAGILAGILVGGVGGRLIMRLTAIIIGPTFSGMRTDNGNLIGDITLPGTVALIAFAGVANGVIGGLAYAALRPWLASLGRWRGLGFGALLLAVLGFAVVTPENPDFARFGPPILNVASFAAIYVLFGAVLVPVAGALDRVTPGISGSQRIGILGIGLAIAVVGALLVGLLLLATLVVTTTLTLTGAAAAGTGFGLANSLVFLGVLAAAVIGRVRRELSATLAIPMLAGAWLTVTAIAEILG